MPMNNPPRLPLEQLAHDVATQLYSASLAEAGYADDAPLSKDLVHAVAVHRARAEGMRIAAETLLRPSELQHFLTLLQVAIREEELQFERDLVGGIEQERLQARDTETPSRSNVPS